MLIKSPGFAILGLYRDAMQTDSLITGCVGYICPNSLALFQILPTLTEDN